MFSAVILLSFSLFNSVLGQQVGTQTAETHPSLSVQQCTASGCTTQSRSIVLDANWRWLHTTSGTTNCYTGNTWDSTLCPDAATCTKNCALDGADYSGTYGITASGNSLKMTFVTKGQYSTNIGSRVYLLSSPTTYQTFNMKNQEFTFDVDMSNLPCGLNGALYFVEMPADGGMTGGNKAGAKYGTGYCDTQCPHDLKFINGEANVLNWTPSTSDVNAGSGKYGSCCHEMDIWEANSQGEAYTPHVCSTLGLTRCDGATCGDSPDNRYGGICDKDGCDFNSYRMGNTSFLGTGKIVDTSKVITVVTRFITKDGTSSGDLSEITRFYVQNGKTIPNSQSTVSGVTGNSITDAFCSAQKTAFGDHNSFQTMGGLKQMGKSFEKGMVLVMSIWDDHTASMLWLDGSYPLDKSPSTPGVARGACDAASGDPKYVEANHPGASVTYSNIRYGPIGSTVKI